MRSPSRSLYRLNLESAEIKLALFAIAVAMMRRSWGSLWCSGRSTAICAISGVMGASVIPDPAIDFSNQTGNAIGSCIRPCRSNHATSKQLIADIARQRGHVFTFHN